MTQQTPHPPARHRASRWLPVAVWAAVIFAGSSVPGSQIPGRFGNLGHFLEYAALGGLLVHALWRGRPSEAGRVAWMSIGLCALYALSDEFHQAFVPLRTPDPLDWTLDVVGASAGLAVVLLASARAARRRPSGLVDDVAATVATASSEVRARSARP